LSQLERQAKPQLFDSQHFETFDAEKISKLERSSRLSGGRVPAGKYR
jgi:hypothetical protein